MVLPAPQRGFTLVEIMLYVAIAATLLMATSLFLSLLLSAQVKAQTIAEVEQQGMQVMQVLTQTARNAEAIASPAVGTSGSSLTLDVLTGANDPTVFDLSGGTIRITEGAGSPVALTNSHVTVSALSFSNLSKSATPGTVRVQFTLTHENPPDRNEYDYARTFLFSATLRQP